METAASTLLMRTLLGRAVEREAIERVGWERLAMLAKQNGVLLRTAARLDAASVAMPPAMMEIVVAERSRAAASLRIVRRVSEICGEAGVQVLFPKATQHLPDVGNDLDLLVGTRSTAIDALLVRELGATPIQSSLVSRVAGTATYLVPGGPPLDVQHGRIGAVGEHEAFPMALLAGRRLRTVDGIDYFVPSADDQLVLQGMQRVYGKKRIRHSDIVYTIGTITNDRLNWDYIISQAERSGIILGLGCYLSYVDQLHRELVGHPLIDASIRARLPMSGWGSVIFRGGFYRYPVARVSAKLYPPSFRAQIRHGNWTGAGRLCLVPLLGVAAALRSRITPLPAAR